MPNTKFDAKSFNPQAFRYLVGRAPNLKTNELRKSRAIGEDADIKRVFSSQNGTEYARLAMKGLLDGEAVNYDGQTDIEATNTKTFEQGVIVVGRAKSWTERDFSSEIAGEDFMANVAAQVGDYKQELDQNTILKVLAGIFSMTGAKNKEFVDKHTYDVCNTGDGAVGVTTLNNAMNQACGANKKKFTLLVMHSDVSTHLENLKIITFLTQTDKDGMTREIGLGTWGGRVVLVDDYVPVEHGYFKATESTPNALKVVSSGTGANTITVANVRKGEFYPADVAADQYVVEGDRYITYVLGNNCLRYQDVGVDHPYSMSRDEKTNGGQTTLYMRQRKAVSPFGISYEKAVQATDSPTDAELMNGANWTLVHSGESSEAARSYINHKAIPICRIISRG